MHLLCWRRPDCTCRQQVLELGKESLQQVAAAMGADMTPEELCKSVEELGRALH